MRLLVLLQLALCVSVALVAAAPIGYADVLMRRIDLANIKTDPEVGKDPATIDAAKNCVKAYCDANVPGAVSATVSAAQVSPSRERMS